MRTVDVPRLEDIQDPIRVQRPSLFGLALNDPALANLTRLDLLVRGSPTDWQNPNLTLNPLADGHWVLDYAEMPAKLRRTADLLNKPLYRTLINRYHLWQPGSYAHLVALSRNMVTEIRTIENRLGVLSKNLAERRRENYCRTHLLDLGMTALRESLREAGDSGRMIAADNLEMELDLAVDVVRDDISLLLTWEREILRSKCRTEFRKQTIDVFLKCGFLNPDKDHL
jgi:hypothetical protein